MQLEVIYFICDSVIVCIGQSVDWHHSDRMNPFLLHDLGVGLHFSCYSVCIHFNLKQRSVICFQAEW